MIKKSAIKPLIITLVVLVLAVPVVLSGFTVVPLEQVEQIALAEEYDPVSYVEEIWESSLIPSFERAVDLALVLNEIQVDSDLIATRESLIPIAEEYGLITLGEAHVYMVRGEGEVVNVDTSSSTGTLELKLDNYDGPIKITLFIGPRIPSDESSVRDSVGFISFGDFREQTEYGKVAAEINRRISQEIMEPLDRESLLGERIQFTGAFTIRTFNLVTIDLTQIRVVPIEIDLLPDSPELMDLMDAPPDLAD